MDPSRVVQALKGTLSMEQRDEAEKALLEVCFTLTFYYQSLEIPVRQAAAVYFRNIVSTSWKDREAERPDEPVPFSIHEQDRESIRNTILDAMATGKWIDAFRHVLDDLSNADDDPTSMWWKRKKWALNILCRICDSEEDDALWSEDPIEYVRIKASDCMMNIDPTDAALNLLHEACLKRRGVLENAMEFCIHLLTSPERDNRSKDGAIHMIGAVAEILLKRKMYKNQMESFLVNHVLPTFEAPEGYRRARACWIIGKLVDVDFKDIAVLHQTTEALKRAMSKDLEIPVRTLAAIGLFDLLRAQERTRELLLSCLPELIMRKFNSAILL
ncbi:unnamed protein product [Protopolystoma xenopodis]|uniref:Importin N-terminal domain-containing protein n=1 Tax=Protopolystoma xenopodis TaxID=117903 RepID=A0A3S5CDS1_9PLAT|nr:unnamed protein product [Protopolystoma xenopodis]